MRRILLLLIFTFTFGNLYAATEISTSGTNIGVGTVSIKNALSVASTLSVGDGSYTNTTAPSGGAIIQGNVGVGSLTPGTKVDVNGTVRATAFSGNGAAITGITSGGFTDDGTVVRLTTVTDNVGIGTTTPQGQLVILGGNVGIGTWSPNSALNVIDTITMGISTGTNVGDNNMVRPGVSSGFLNLKGGSGRAKISIGNDQIQFIAGNNNAYMVFKYGATSSLSSGTEAMRIDGVDGNVGIGTTTPQDKLIVMGNVGLGTWTAATRLDTDGLRLSTNPAAGYVLVSDTTGIGTWMSPSSIGAGGGTSGWSTGTGTVYNTTGSDNVGIGTSTPQGGLVVTNGNVGIGTWAPLNTLHVVGNISVGNSAGTNGGDDNMIRPGVTSSFLNLKGGAGRAKISLSNDQVQIISGNSSSYIVLKYGASSSISTGTEAMRIDGSSGNVGIGSSAPGVKLDITGTVRISTGTAGQAACWKADKSLGQCTTVVGATGDCTCS